MVLCIPGQGSPEWATAIAAVGVTILFAAGCNPVAGKMVGPRASLRRKAQGHHAGRTVSKNPPPPSQYRTPAGCELPFLHPDDAGMETTGEQIRGGQKDK
jgi:hypothetical protein